MAQVFFTADLHFGHDRIRDLAGRPFTSVEEMDEALIENWNTVVRRPEDIVWVLGDYALGDRTRGLGYLSRLNGRKMLVSGNHDKCFVGASDGWKHVETYRSVGFEIVTPWAHTKLPPVAPNEPGRKVFLSHFPYDGDSYGPDRLSGARLRDEGAPLIHGHVHEEFVVRRSKETRAVQVNVGVDVHDYRPVSAEQVAALVVSA